ncbi:hypothetical protein [Amycolatopsis speibonae]|uniref:Band 7 domain-containing protein n=1 Tax=Amycolatopsis speibonae TaxID=1450224 RepID=A0ABV7NSB7_9PSEU
MSEEPADDGKVVRTMDVSRASLRKVNPASSGHTAIVYLTRRGTYELATSKLTMGELWLDTPSEMYTVDLTTHDDVLSLELPSREEAFRFPATVHVSWRVSDPIIAVRTGLNDPVGQVRRALEGQLRTVTRKFSLTENPQAEAEINAIYQGKPIVVSPALLIDRCSVLIDPEAGQRRHVEELRVTAHDRQLSMLREENDLALKKQRMDMYSEALRADNMSMLALVLAGHGEDAKAVINLVLREKDKNAEQARGVLDMLIEKKLVNRHDVKEIMNDAARTVADHIGDVNPLAARTPVAVEEKPPPTRVTSRRVDDDDDDDDDEDDDA